MRGDLRNTARHWSPGAFQPPGGFCDVGCCCCFFDLVEVFTFSGYFSMPSALQPGFSGLHRLWALPWLLSVALLLPTFLDFLFLPRVLRFWASIFYPRFYPTLFCLWLRWGQKDPIQDPPLCLPSQSCPFGRTHGLELFMFELQDYWFINCASEPRSIELKLSY